MIFFNIQLSRLYDYDPKYSSVDNAKRFIVQELELDIFSSKYLKMIQNTRCIMINEYFYQ